MPINRKSAIAFTVALGADGWPDTNASARNANGTSASPNAMNAAGFATPSPSSDATETSPMSVPQNAGNSTSVAIVIAFHFCCGDSGAIPADRDRFDPLHPFTDPAVRPRTK